jgi:NAD(P)-dependent dehydrogenase (short-subunit alcohol dehydrogenase family)
MADGGVLERFRLDDKVIVITGASSGLGRRFAQVVASVGASVVLAARRAERVESLARSLRDGGTQAIAVPADVSRSDDCRAIAAAAEREFGRVDGLVNNAGTGSTVPASRESEEYFRGVVDVNLLAPFWLARECVPLMPPGSAVVNVASIMGLVASPYPQASYAATKAGLIGLTRDLAQQWSSRKGVRVNALCPGYFASEMTVDNLDSLVPMVEERTVLRRMGAEHELDGALLFLLSGASSYVTGTTVTVDGGYTVL